MSIAEFLLVLIAIFGSAKLFGEIAERLGQPAVLGELIAGVVVGVSGFALVNPGDPTVQLLSQLGVILLLFLIGLETDLSKLLAVGSASTVVAVVGVALPFLLGFLAGRQLGFDSLLSIFLGATLTATSVGITARVFADLGHLHARESQVVLGAAVIDDIIGLVILTVVSAIARGESLTTMGIVKIAAIAFGFVALALLLGKLFAPPLVRLVAKLRVGKALLFTAIMFAFGLAYLAEELGSAMIVGAFAAGVVLARTERGHQIEREVRDIAQFFIPIFFVTVGAAIDLRQFNPLDPQGRRNLVIGLLLTLVAVVGKLIAGFSAPGRGLRRLVIGVGMVPRGEVGLIFAQIGLASGLVSGALYSSVALMVMITTMVTPPALRALLPRRAANAAAEGGIAEYVVDAPLED